MKSDKVKIDLLNTRCGEGTVVQIEGMGEVEMHISVNLIASIAHAHNSLGQKKIHVNKGLLARITVLEFVEGKRLHVRLDTTC